MAGVKDIRNFDPVKVMLGGKERTIQFDMNAYAELENKYGSVEQAMEQLQGGRMTDIRTILWVGLIHEEAVIDEESGEPIKYNITPYQVGSWIKNPGMLKDMSLKLTEAMSQGMSEEDIEEAQNEAKNI